MLVKVFQAVVCTVCCATLLNIEQRIFTEYLQKNCNFSKVRHRLPDDGPNGPKHVGAIMRYFNCIF